MLNQVVLMGRLTRDPELRHTQSGVPVASFSLAVERDYKGKQSDGRETDFIDIVAWQQAGEFAAKYFAKGSFAVVKGRLQIRSYEDKEGNNRIAPEVVAESIYFAGDKRNSNKEEVQPEKRKSSKKKAESKPLEDDSEDEVKNENEEDEDLPF